MIGVVIKVYFEYSRLPCEVPVKKKQHKRVENNSHERKVPVPILPKLNAIYKSTSAPSIIRLPTKSNTGFNISFSSPQTSINDKKATTAQLITQSVQTVYQKRTASIQTCQQTLIKSKNSVPAFDDNI